MTADAIAVASKGVNVRMRVGRICMAVLCAAGVNVLLFILLASFKGSVPVNTDQNSQVRISIMHQYENERPEIEPLIREEPVPEMEIMEVDLDFDSPVVINLKPVEVDSSVPFCPMKRFNISEPAITDIPVLMSEERVDIPPQQVSCPLPRYPRNAVRRGIEGLVIVKLLINEQGLVEDSRIVSVQGHDEFGRSVTETVKMWRFKPARHKGRTVKVWALKRIRFRIED